MTFGGTIILGNTLYSWLIALSLSIATLVALQLLRNILRRRIAALAQHTKTDIDDLIASLLDKVGFLQLAVLALFTGAQALSLSTATRNWLHTALLFAILIQIAVWGDSLVIYGFNRYQTDQLEEDAGRATTIRAMSFVVRLALISLVVLLALDNIPGVEITTLLASLGVGGIAVALAVQNILGDLLASLSLALDKPFVIGDFIIIGDYLGTVEHIGLKTTRVRSLSGEQLIFSNSDLLSSRIRNYKRMGERRVVFSIGITYQTPHHLLRQVPALIREIVEARPQTRFDRAHFKSYGDFSLNFEVVYYVLSPDYNLHMDIQQEINLALFERFEREGLEFAYPTQTVLVHRQPA